MAVVKHTGSDINLLARLLRAEAEGEGVQGMLLVGNVGINRIRGNCSDFKGLRTIPQMVYQPHAFEATTHGYFYERYRGKKKNVLLGEQLKANGFGLRNLTTCGIFDLRVIVLPNGTINLL